MHSALFICRGGKAIRIGALQLAVLTVFEDITDNGVIGAELFQNIRTRGVAALRLFRVGKAQLFKEDDAELLGRIDIEFLTCRLVDTLTEFLLLCAKRFGE